MTESESEHIIKEVKAIIDKLTDYSERAQLESFLGFYDESPAFLHIAGDGIMRNYSAFKQVCSEYYNSLKAQKIITIREEFHVVDSNLVISGWTGNIIAEFKNGDIMKMNNYSITNLFKKIDDRWKIIHSHESSLPPEIIKK